MSLYVFREELMDGDIFYFPGDIMYVYEYCQGMTYTMGDDTPLPIERTRTHEKVVIVIHNCYGKREKEIYRG